MLSATKNKSPCKGQKRFCFWTPAGRSVYFFIILFVIVSIAIGNNFINSPIPTEVFVLIFSICISILSCFALSEYNFLKLE